MHSHCFVLLLCLSVCVFVIYYILKFFSLWVFVCICLYITTLVSSYFSAWPSHSVGLAFAMSEWLCCLFSQLFPFNHSTLLYQEHNKGCCCCCRCCPLRGTVFKMSLASFFMCCCFLGKPPMQPFFTLSFPTNLCWIEIARWHNNLIKKCFSQSK